MYMFVHACVWTFMSNVYINNFTKVYKRQFRIRNIVNICLKMQMYQ